MPDIKKVLVVDDDASLISLLKDYLPKVIKHELYVALTGEEALKILEEKKPDVLLLDMQLPGIKGPQVLRIIREKYPQTKVLVITAYDRQVKEISAKLGVDGFFPKPLVLNELVDRVEEVLKAKEPTTVTPVTLDEVKKIEGIAPKATILFIEENPLMLSLLPISDMERTPDYPIERYGLYNYEAVYWQDQAMAALKRYKPDIVICATHVPKTLAEKPGLIPASVSTADLISEIMKSKYAPKAVIVHGKQQDIDSFASTDLTGDSGTWIEKENMHDFYDYTEDQDKRNAERLNKMLWRICFKYNLVEKTK